MSAEVASFEKVKEAVESIRRRNAVPTADRVIAYIGGGSKQTVLSHLRALRSPKPDEDDVPAGIFEGARAALADIYRAGASAEAARAKAATERLASGLIEQEAQIEELAEDNTRLQKLVKELVRQRDGAMSDRSRSEERLASALAEKKGLEVTLANERDRRSEGIEEAISRIETLVASGRPVPGGKQRQTLGLPDKG